MKGNVPEMRQILKSLTHAGKMPGTVGQTCVVYIMKIFILGSRRYLRTTRKMGSASSRSGHQQYIQTLPSSRTPEAIKGNVGSIFIHLF